MSGDNLKDDLREVIREALEDEEAKKRIDKTVRDLVCQIEGDLEYGMKDDLADSLSAWVVEMAGRSVTMILEGNEGELRRYLSCEKRGPDGHYVGWTGRSDAEYWGRKREDHEWHSVIHGEMFEQGAVALRKKIVDAHRDTLVNERILDLEDQVRSLVAQVNKANAEKEAMWERCRNYTP